MTMAVFTLLPKNNKFMLRFYFTIILLFFVFKGFSQEISGKAFYTSIIKAEKLELSQKQMENEQFRDLAEQLNKSYSDEFVLDFTQEESIFKKLPQLEKPNPSKSGMSIRSSIMGDVEILYKNINENIFLNEKDLYSKKFLIEDDLKKLEWELTNESKTIGDYICFKATYLPKSDTPDEESIDEKGRKQIIAWYTPQIPVKNGPKEYGGLPGLILEVQEGKQIFLCTKIVLSPTETVSIIKPSKGKKVNQKEFKAIMKTKNAEMMENFKSQRRRN